MPNLNIKFSGLFLWVPTDKAMYVLAPPTSQGEFAVEEHVTRLLLPGSPQLHDIGGMELKLAGGGIEDAVLENHFDCSCDGGMVMEELLAGPPQEGLALQNRFELNAGALTHRHAPIEFYIGGEARQCIASELTWCYPLPDDASHVTLKFTWLSSGMPALAPITLQAGKDDSIDIEIHHVPQKHLPGGEHSSGHVRAFQIAKHLPALYNLMVGYRTMKIPLTVGGHHELSAAMDPPSGGGDPVTCGQGTARLKAKSSGNSVAGGAHANDDTDAPVPAVGD